MEAYTKQELTEQIGRKLVREAIEVQAAEKLSNNTIARVLGYSPAVWSQVKSGKYKGNTKELYIRLQQWLRSRLTRNEMPETPFVATQIARRILTVCRRAGAMPAVGLVITRSGLGKTAALLEHKRRIGHRCVYIQAGECLSTKVALAGELASKLGVAVAPTSTAAQRYHMVRGKLADMYAGGAAEPVVILIDEATTLRPNAINMLRNLHDDPACRPGIVLADTWRLGEELRCFSPRRGTMPGGYEQLTSRAGAQYRIDAGEEISQADVTMVTTSILAGLGCRRRLQARSYTALHTFAQEAGGLRNVQHRLQAVCDMAEASDATATFSVTELDFVAPMLGATCQLAHTTSPFATSKPRASKRRAG